MPIASSSFSSGCHDGSVVSIAELFVLELFEAFKRMVCDGEGAAGGMMDCGCCCGAGAECL
jgi:hypothetical protein